MDNCILTKPQKQKQLLKRRFTQSTDGIEYCYGNTGNKLIMRHGQIYISLNGLTIDLISEIRCNNSREFKEALWIFIEMSYYVRNTQDLYDLELQWIDLISTIGLPMDWWEDGYKIQLRSGAHATIPRLNFNLDLKIAMGLNYDFVEVARTMLGTAMYLHSADIYMYPNFYQSLKMEMSQRTIKHRKHGYLAYSPFTTKHHRFCGCEWCEDNKKRIVNVYDIFHNCQIFGERPLKAMLVFESMDELDYERVGKSLFDLAYVCYIQHGDRTRIKYQRGRTQSWLWQDIYNTLLHPKIDVDKMTGFFERAKHFLNDEPSVQSMPDMYGFNEIIEILLSEPSVQSWWNGKFEHVLNLSDSSFKRIQFLLDKFVMTFERMAANVMSKVAHVFKICMITFLTFGLTYMLLTKGVPTTVATASALLVLKVLVPDITKCVKDRFLGPRVQSLEEEHESIFAILTRYMIETLVNPGKRVCDVWKSPIADLFIKRMAYFGDNRVKDGFEFFKEFFDELVTGFKRFLFVGILGTATPEDFLSERAPHQKWMDEVQKLQQSRTSGTLRYNELLADQLNAMYKQGNIYMQSRLYRKDYDKIRSHLITLLRIMEVCSSKIISPGSVRNPPVTIIFTGETGEGKSSLCYPFALSLLKRIFDREDPERSATLIHNWKQSIYVRASEQEFWDGYCGQFITMFDDFGQRVDSASNPSIELFEVIRGSNMFAFPLHMAQLEDKATTNFTSKIIIASSNLDKIKTESLNYPDALYRRFNICVKVQRIDKTKTEFDENNYRYQLFDMVRGVPGDMLTFEQLLERADSSYVNNKEFLNSISGWIARRLAPGEPVVQSLEETIEQVAYKCALEQEQLRRREERLKREAVRIQIKPISHCLVDGEFGLAWRKLKFKFMSSPTTSSWSSLTRLSNKFRFVGTESMSLGEKLKSKFELDPADIDVWWSNVRRMNDWALRLLKLLGLASVIAGGLYMGYSIYQSLLGGEQKPGRDKAEKNRILEKLRNEREKNEKIMDAIKENGTNELVAYVQSIVDANSEEVLSSVVKRNYYKLLCVVNGKDEVIGSTLFLKGQIALMNEHFKLSFDHFLKQDRDAKLKFVSHAGTKKFTCYLRDLKFKSYGNSFSSDLPSNDAMTVEIKEAYRHHDITPQFVERHQMSKVKYLDVKLPLLVYADGGEPQMIIKYAPGDTYSKWVNDPTPAYCGTEKRVHYVAGWEYFLETRNKDCGAPLIIRNSKIGPGKIVGIHSNGTPSGKGFCPALFREDIEDMLKPYGDIITMEVYSQVTEQETLKYPECEFEEIGKVEKPVFANSKTKIRKSPVYECFGPAKTKPCALHTVIVDGERFDPREYRTRKLGKPNTPIPEPFVKRAKKTVSDFVCGVLIANKSRLTPDIRMKYTYSETVKGIPGERFINSVKRTTSMGYPFVLSGMTRFDVWGRNDEYDLTRPESKKMEESMNNILREAEQGRGIPAIFVQTLKDERKPLKKAHQTRQFSAGPLDYLLACKNKFQGVVAAIETCKNECGISVGTNPYSDYGSIARLLLKNGNRIGAGDFSGFDASQNREMLEAATEVLIDVAVKVLDADKVDVMQMRTLMESLLASYQLSHDHLVRWTHSLPSGHFLTAIVNSIFSLIVITACYDLALYKRDNQFVNVLMLSKLFRDGFVVAYGDDHLICFPLDTIGIFNELTMPDLMSFFGMEYTLESKEGVASQPFRLLKDVTYLKRGFRHDNELHSYCAPLALDTVLETPYWNKGVADAKGQAIENLEHSLLELSLHDEGTWDTWFPKIHEVLVEKLNFFTNYNDYRSTQLIAVSLDDPYA
uniref:Non-structural polyprotein n=1 Tax=Crocidura shantungensis ribovirus 1 TaxID=3139529 RepID=A0AB38ZK48_9VIRU